MGGGSGTFVRIDVIVHIKNGDVFTFGDYHVAVNCNSKKKHDPDKTISIQIYDGNQPKEQLYI